MGAKSGGKKRPSSVNAGSRLLRGTYASKGKTANPFEEDPEAEDQEDDYDID